MSDRYWVGTNGGSWTPTTTGGWSASSGGPSGASVPTQIDNVFFDANSGSNSIAVNTGAANCHNLILLGYLGLIDFATSLSCFGSLELSDAASSSVGLIKSSGGLVRMAGAGSFQITSHGKAFSLCSIRFDNVNGQWTLGDDIFIKGGAASLDLRSGSFNSNNKTITIDTGDFLATNGTGVRVANLGASTVSIGRDLKIGANATFNSGASITVSGTLACNGTDATHHAKLFSAQAGTQCSISAASLGSLTHTDIRDIAASGTGAPWSGTDLIDLGNNSGITF